MLPVNGISCDHLEEQKKIQKNMPVRKCSDCLKDFSCRQSLFVHKKKCKGREKENETSMDSVGSQNYKFNDISLYRKDIPARKCSDCLKDFSCRQSLFVHKKKCKQREKENERSMDSVETQNYKYNDIISLVKHLKIPNFKGPFKCNELSGRPENQECGIVYLDPSHLVAYYKDGDKRMFFDSLGQPIPTEIKKYLKTEQEFRDDVPVIQCSRIVKPTENGHVCLYVLDNLSKGQEFQDVINSI